MSDEDQLAFLGQTMKNAADNLDFENAINIRDEMEEIQRRSKKGKNVAARVI
jgi:excinuclease UvrABC helicase subunit UvrB